MLKDNNNNNNNDNNIALIVRVLSALQINTGFNNLRVLESPMSDSRVMAQIASR